jgi:hypothetical protein
MFTAHRVLPIAIVPQLLNSDLWLHLNQTIEDWHMPHVTLSGAKGLAVSARGFACGSA